MSVDWYMGCTKCKEALHVAQDGLSGFTFYRGQPDTMKLLGELLDGHNLCGEGTVRLLSEYEIDDNDAYKVRDSHGELKPDLDGD